MTFFVFSICLMAERFLGSLDSYRKFAWFTAFRNWLLSRFKPDVTWKGRLVLLALYAIPVVALQVAYIWLFDVLAILGFLFACWIVLYCFGPKGFYEETRAFCDAVRGRQDDTARWYAAKLLDQDFQDFKETPPADIAPLIGEHIYVIANDRIFAIMFWFALLGPVGALLYRLSSLTHRHMLKTGVDRHEQFRRQADRVHYWLSWAPSRLLVLSYAATGNFVESMSRCSQGAPSCADRWPDLNERLLVCAGTGQDQPDQHDLVPKIELGLALLRRTTVLWVGLTALITLTRWAS